MPKTDKQKIIQLCNSINKKDGEGSIYTLGSKHANLKINRWSTGIEDLDEIIGGGIPEGRVIEIFGAEGCLDGSTLIACSYGKSNKHTKFEIKDLYRRFHRIHCGDGRKDRCLDYDGDYCVRSVNENGVVISQKIADVVDCGVKKCYEVKTESGKTIVCTDEHRFLTEDKEYTELRNIRVGDSVYVHNNVRTKKEKISRPKYETVIVKYHPFGSKKLVQANGYKGKKKYHYERYQLGKHVLVYEAYLNGYTFDEYVDILNNAPKDFIIKKLKFVNSKVYDVHHIDFDSTNNVVSNLQLIEKKEHNRLHSLVKIENLSYKVVLDKIVSIEEVGERATYDIKCYAPYNNYIANGFVTHNSGKTTLLYHLCSLHNMALDIPIEGTFDAGRAKVFGNRPKQLLVYRARYGEDAFNKTVQFAKAGMPLIGIDSVPSMVPKEDAEKVLKSADRDSIEEQRIGGTARLMNKYLPTVEEIIEVTGTTVIFINQIRDKMQAMMFGEKFDTPGGHKLKHAASIRIAVARRAWIEIPNKNPKNSAANEKVGFIMKCKVMKSKVSNPMGECEIPCFFDRGFVSFDDVKPIRQELMAQRAAQFGKRSRWSEDD